MTHGPGQREPRMTVQPRVSPHPPTPPSKPTGSDPRGGHLIHPLYGRAPDHRVGWRCLGMNPHTGRCTMAPRWWNLSGRFWGRLR